MTTETQEEHEEARRLAELKDAATAAEVAYREYGLGKSPDDAMLAARERFEQELDPEAVLALFALLSKAEQERDEQAEAFHRTMEEASQERQRAEAAERELERLREAINNAEYALHPNQGERPDPSLASQWLRTTFPADHPNYIDRTALSAGTQREEGDA